MLLRSRTKILQHTTGFRKLHFSEFYIDGFKYVAESKNGLNSQSLISVHYKLVLKLT